MQCSGSRSKAISVSSGPAKKKKKKEEEERHKNQTLGMECVEKRFKTQELEHFVHFTTFYILHDFKSKIILRNRYIDLQKLDMSRKNNGFCYMKLSHLLATVKDRASKLQI